MKGYNTSKDYERLKELLNKGYEVLLLSPIFIVGVCKKCTLSDGYAVRGKGWVNFIVENMFDDICQHNGIEFIEPEWETVGVKESPTKTFPSGNGLPWEAAWRR